MGKSSQRGSDANGSGSPNHSQGNNYRFAIACVAVIVGFAVLVYGINQGWFQGGDEAAQQEGEPEEKDSDDSDNNASQSRDPNEGRKGWTKVGGIWRPATDVGGKRRLKDAAQGSVRPDPGRIEPVKGDANEHVQSMVEALKTGKFPERLSATAPPAKFDPEAYKKEPDKYLNIVEPGRVFQPAQPGPDVVRIARFGTRLKGIVQGETVPLKVRATPDAPVTFTSFDLGAFENKLPTITVRADKKGVAEVQFTGTKGTFNDVNILAASPVTSGRVEFVVSVSLPGEVAKVEESKK